MTPRRPGILLPLLLLVMLIAAVDAAATESFPATHVAAFTVPGGRVTVRNRYGIFRLDRARRVLEYRITFGGTPEMVADLRLARRLPERLGTPDRVLRTVPVGLTIGTLSGALTGLTDEEIAAIDSNVALMVFTSESRPDGLAEGMLEAAPSGIATSISGGQEVPQVSTDGYGNATIVLDRKLRSARYFIHWAELSAPATGIQFRRGRPGEPGTTVEELAAPLGTSGDCVGEWTMMTDDEMAALAAGEIFVNIYTSAHPAGEIRGRFDPIDIFTARIEPANVVPPPAGTATATGTGIFILQTGADSVPMATAFVAISAPGAPITAAHLRRGARGTNGPIFAGLPDGGEGLFTLPPEAMSDPADLLSLRAGGIYVQLLDSAFPEGETRGQLIPAQPMLTSAGGIHAQAPFSVADIRFDPATGTIVWLLPEGVERGTLLVDDPAGRRALTAACDSRRGAVDARSLPSGLYLATIVTSHGAFPAARIGIVR